MRRPRMKFHISYQMIVWALVTIAIILAGGFLIISYIYKLQDETNSAVEQNVRSARTAKELLLSLYDIRAASLTYLFDRSPERIAILQEKQSEFITQFMCIGGNLPAKSCKCGITISLCHIAQDLVIGPVFLDDIKDMADGRWIPLFSGDGVAGFTFRLVLPFLRIWNIGIDGL